MLLIGLTGNIAFGKSTVAQMLADRGATIIDADELARNAVAYGSDGHRKIVERWGDDILKADGGLDRVALRQIVFQEPTELEALNSIVHPDDLSRVNVAFFTLNGVISVVFLAGVLADVLA